MEITDDEKSLEGFKARMVAVGVDGKALDAMLNDIESLDEEGKEHVADLLEMCIKGQTLDPIYFPRDKNGQFTGYNPWTWRKGMKSPNPLGKPRTRIGLWGRFCQIMELTPDSVAELLTRTDLTLADRAAITMALKTANDGAWAQQLEVINREEGKIQEKIQIDTPPQPIKFVESPGRDRTALDDEEEVVAPIPASASASKGGAEDEAEDEDKDDEEEVKIEEVTDPIEDEEKKAIDNEALWKV